MMTTVPRSNPFQLGQPIQNPQDFVGREAVLNGLCDAMDNLQNVSVVGGRGLGKTSLLLYLAHPDTGLFADLLPKRVPVYFTFQGFGNATEPEVWQAIAMTITEQIQKRYPDSQQSAGDFRQTVNRQTSTVTAFEQGFRVLEKAGLVVHLLLDEFEQLAQNPGITGAFYQALRRLAELHNVSFVIATDISLAEVETPKAVDSSLFSSLFVVDELSLFNKPEVHALVFSYLLRAGIDRSLVETLWSRLESNGLREITGYHPYLLQALCYHLFERLEEPEWPSEQDVVSARSAFLEDVVPLFDHYLQTLTEKEQKLVEALARGRSIGRGDPENERVIERLKRCCLVVPTDETEYEVRLFSSVFSLE
jgi:hypothetical protein